MNNVKNLKGNYKMTNKSDTKNEVDEKVIETKEITIIVLFSDLSIYPNLAVNLQRLVMNEEIKFIGVKPTHYIVRGMDHLLKSIYE